MCDVLDKSIGRMPLKVANGNIYYVEAINIDIEHNFIE